MHLFEHEYIQMRFIFFERIKHTKQGGLHPCFKNLHLKYKTRSKLSIFCNLISVYLISLEYKTNLCFTGWNEKYQCSISLGENSKFELKQSIFIKCCKLENTAYLLKQNSM